MITPNHDFIPSRDGVIEADEAKIQGDKSEAEYDYRDYGLRELDTADQVTKKDFAKALKEKVIPDFLTKLRRHWRLALGGAALAGVAFGVVALNKSSCCDDSATNLVQAEIDRIKDKPHDPIHVGLSLIYDPEEMSVDVLDSSVKLHMDNCGEQHEGAVKKLRGTRVRAGGILDQAIQVKFDTPHDGEPYCYRADTYLQDTDFTRTSTGPDALFVAKKVHFEMEKSSECK